MMRVLILLFISMSFYSIGLIAQEHSIGLFSEPLQNGKRLYPGMEDDERAYKLKLYNEADLDSHEGRYLVKENFYYTDQTYKLNGSSVLLPGGLKLNITASASNYSSVIHLNFQEFYLTFSESKNGFVKVRLAEESYWINEQEIQDKGIELLMWKDFFKVGSEYSLAPLEDMSVYEDARDDADLAAIIPGSPFYEISPEEPYYLIESILMIEGKWMQVAVKQWNSWKDYTMGGPESDTTIGWIIYLDETGSTRIFSTQNFGC